MQDGSSGAETSSSPSPDQSLGDNNIKPKVAQAKKKPALVSIKHTHLTKARNNGRKGTPAKGKKRPEIGTGKENAEPALQRAQKKPTNTMSKYADQSQTSTQPSYRQDQLSNGKCHGGEASLISSKSPKKRRRIKMHGGQATGRWEPSSNQEKGEPFTCNSSTCSALMIHCQRRQLIRRSCRVDKSFSCQ